MASPQYNPRRQQKPVEKKRKRSGASPARGESVQVPGWMWLVGGVAVGVFISFLVKLAHAPQPPQAAVGSDSTATATVQPLPKLPEKEKRAPSEPVKSDPAKTAVKPDAKVADKVADKPAADETQSVTKFDFYTLLPEREVIVPNDREALKAVDKQKAQAGQATAAAGADEQLLLQVGSFRSAQEAERRRVQVVSLALEARVELVLANGDTWYRVQAGPFTSREQLSKARDHLAASGIESLLLKQKPKN